MESKEIGRFYAQTFGNDVYEFIVKDNGRMYCDFFENFPLYRIDIKPRFKLYGIKDNKRRCFLSPAISVGGLIKSYIISDELFDYLRSNNMLLYSTDMAYLYDFKDKEGYDRLFQKRAYKHVHEKQKILSKQKRGYYN